MTKKIYLLHRIHKTPLKDFFKQTIQIGESPSLERAQEAMHALSGSCVIIRGEIIDDNCPDSEE